MIVGVPKETFPGERRVALIPVSLAALGKAGLDVCVEVGAGVEAGFPDAAYAEAGAKTGLSREDVFAQADVIAQVRTVGANPAEGQADLERMRKGQVVLGHAEPLSETGSAKAVSVRGATLFALELMPRITRAQSMDVLSSMATVAGYKAVVLAAETLPRMFPMMMTAAGTVAPARVLIVGAGVAGLQAIASSRRMGAVVQAYDVRPAVKEQVESLGAKFVELDLETGEAETKGGYAKEMSDEFIRKQREAMGKVVAGQDVVITTAAVPGRKAPVIVTEEMVAGMEPGSVIVDLAAERGGNCAVTRAGETVDHGGVKVLGPTNLPATVPYHASQMYAKNVTTFLLHLVEEGAIKIDLEDEITRETLVTRDGDVVHPRVRELLGMPVAGEKEESRE